MALTIIFPRHFRLANCWRDSGPSFVAVRLQHKHGNSNEILSSAWTIVHQYRVPMCRVGRSTSAVDSGRVRYITSLARAAGLVKSREQLLLEVADRDFEVFDRSIDVHVSSLRKKLGDDRKAPRFISTVRSIGYMMRKPGTDNMG